MSLVRCPSPDHSDSTPSVKIYQDAAYCFGCGKRYDLSLFGIDTQSYTQPKAQENIKASLERISKLPKREIRGLALPYDTDGYYIVWPCNRYYLKRYFNTDNKQNKYYCPKGITRPPFQTGYNPSAATSIVFIEGELNAMSLNVLGSEALITSPGGASNFGNLDIRWLPQFRDLAVKIIVDNDKAGIDAALKLRAKLLPYGITPDIYLMEEDINAQVVKYGQEAVREELKEKMGLSFRL